MEVNFSPETEKKLNTLAVQSGRETADELVRDIIEEYFGDLAQAREVLDGRYDDLESGKIKLVPGDEVVARLRAKSALYRASRDESVPNVTTPSPPPLSPKRGEGRDNSLFCTFSHGWLAMGYFMPPLRGSEARINLS
jgi:predicted DNA-binding protein